MAHAYLGILWEALLHRILTLLPDVSAGRTFSDTFWRPNFYMHPRLYRY